ncbi:MAG: 2-iminoacetate synthase ThiH [Verrucomicrobiota bacterium]|nr:2-iminoacetate synthase ThiH [Verrucomicrobiota bacterium]
MSFAIELSLLPLETLLERARSASRQSVLASLASSRLGLEDFAHLISPAAADHLEALARRAHSITTQRFGRVVRLFAPIYLSNECVNNCAYCGFARSNAIRRVTLSLEEVLQEARALKAKGFRNLLLVAGEHPKLAGVDYLESCVRMLHKEIPSLSLEVGALDTHDYRRLVAAGAEGLVIYQETYNRPLYAELHRAGPKRDFDWRIEAPERAHAAGFRRLGIGALLGLNDWRSDAICVAAHASYLLRNCWRSCLTISVPRLRPSAGHFSPRFPVTDRELAQLVCAFRIFLPDVGIVLSTREPAGLRDGLIPLGITLMSAGSHTEPGGYTGAGHEHVRATGQFADGDDSGQTAPAAQAQRSTDATGQFDVADNRSPAEVADRIRQLGYEPVWKDWDFAFGDEPAMESAQGNRAPAFSR